jgi:G6PDH family F420-dependent oxidoreductase
MVKLGYTLFSELNGPNELVAQASRAEETGFDFAVISDHYHPWLNSHSDSPFAWSVLGAVAATTERIGLMTLVTCPFLRYHPAIVAQAAATIAIMSGNRFTLGLGAGERLNEHVVGRGWPPVDIRHEMLTESVEAMQQLWSGGFGTYRGRHITVEDARLYSLPDEPPPIAIAGSGDQSIELAAGVGGHFIAIEPDPDLVAKFEAASPGKRKIGQVAISYDRDEAKATEQAMRFAFGVSGWKVMAELPNPVNFEAAISTVRPDDVTEMVATGPDPERAVEAITEFADAGYDEIAVVQVGDDIDGFFSFWTEEVAPRLDR